MKLLEKIIAVFAPFDCLGCGDEGPLICSYCRQLFPDVPERCYRCRRLRAGCLTCPACRKISRLAAVLVVTDYEGIAKQLLWRLKYGNAPAAAELIAALMAERLKRAGIAPDCIVPVPTTPGRARSRGYDQAVLISHQLAATSRLPHLNALARHGKSRQVGASRQERINQLSSAFRSPGRRLKDANVLLVDDVVTTGATLEAAARTLRQAGAAKVYAIVFAQP